jgi:hypothetical protein
LCIENTILKSGSKWGALSQIEGSENNGNEMQNSTGVQNTTQVNAIAAY